MTVGRDTKREGGEEGGREGGGRGGRSRHQRFRVCNVNLATLKVTINVKIWNNGK